MKRSLLFCLLSLSISLHAQLYSDSVKAALVNIYSQVYVYPQEKLYVQTDRPYYISGEKIFFRANLLLASTLRPSSHSRYVYVELVSPVDTVIVRKQLKMDSDHLYYGSLSLPETLPEGTYRIRAYTRYMENMGESGFYTRSVYISDPNSSKNTLETEFDYSKRGRVGVSLRFLDAKTKERRFVTQVGLLFGLDKKPIMAQPDEKGWINKQFDLKANDSRRTCMVEYKDGRNSYNQYISIPYAVGQPELSFYPEGGSLIGGQTCRVAFKALLPGGETVEIKGSVFNSRNELQTTFGTQHNGMGSFLLNTRIGESYYARFEYNNLSVETKLPVVAADGYSLQTQWEDDSLSVRVCKSETLPIKQYYLLIHHQGVPTYFQPWDFSTNKMKLNKARFVSGVSHLMLLNSNFGVVSERMVFNNLHDEALVDVHANQKSYHPRSPVSLAIELADARRDTVVASLAIGVTDDKDVKLDTTTNIVAEMLLASELKGQVNEPAWYFGEDKTAESSADLLMLTQGWRLYHVAEALKGNLQHPKMKPEVSQWFSGVLKTPTGRPYPQGKIKMTAVGYNYSDVVEADDKGRYQFTDFEFPDSTSYFFLASTKEKTADVEVCPDAISYPSITLPWTSSGFSIVAEQKNPDFTDYVLKANTKYLRENGLRMVDLPEVQVNAKKKKAEEKRFDNNTGFFSVLHPDQFLSAKELLDAPASSFEQLFLRLRGVSEVTEYGPRARGEYFKILINGIKREYPDLDQIVHVSEIGQVDLYADFNTIILTTRSADMYGNEAEATNRAHILPLGYQQAVEFYSPKYDTPDMKNSPKADLRSTIYWKPNLVLNQNQSTPVEFYTADTPGTYSVVVEGIGASRKLIYCRKKGLIKVEKEKKE